MKYKNVDVLKKNKIPRHYTGKKPFHIPRKEIVTFPKDWKDFDNILNKTILNIVPDKKCLDKDSKVLTFGSCFANNLAIHLEKNSIETTALALPANLQNVFSVESFFKWIVENIKDDEYWQEYDGHSFNPSDSRELFLQDVKNANAFVITLGLSEIWKDKLTDKIFWRAVPKEIYDENRHSFELANVYDTVESIGNIVNNIRKVNEEAVIILTLSPVPLSATFRGISCIVADCVSKSIIRVAIDTYMTTHTKDQNIFYWPSYEIVKDVMTHYNKTSYGEDDGYHRHVNNSLVEKIINKFISSYFE